MKTLLFDEKRYQAEKIVKTDTDIVGYINNTVAFTFRGIKDFSLFQLEEGQEWDIDEEIEKMNYLLDLDFRLSKLELGV